jgi:hypothetical protein
MSKRKREVVGPCLHKGAQEDGDENNENKDAGDPAVYGKGPFFERPGGLKKRTGLTTDKGITLFG